MEGVDAEGIAIMMKAELGVHKAVVVEADGTTREVQLDMTPQRQAIQGCVGGAVEFLGQWEPLGVILVVRRQSEAGALSKSEATLPKPFDEAEFRGAVVLTRSDETGAPLDYSLEEYSAFAAKAPEPWQEAPEEAEDEDEDEDDEKLAAVAEDEGDDEDEDEDFDGEEDEDGDDEEMRQLIVDKAMEAFEQERGRAPTDEERSHIEAAIMEKLQEDEGDDDDDDGDDDDDEGHDEMLQMILGTALEAFEKERGRAPTDEERSNIEAAIMEKLGGGEEDEDEDDELDVSEAEMAMLGKIASQFEAVHGRVPTNEEVEEILTRLSAAAEEAEAEDEDGEEDEGEEGEGEEGDILQQLVELFKKQNGRDPTEEEMEQWKATFAEVAGEKGPPDDEPQAKRARQD